MSKPLVNPFEALNDALAAIESFLEPFRGLVAALKEDGFTDREARMIVAGVFGPKNDPDNKPPEPEEDP